MTQHRCILWVSLTASQQILTQIRELLHAVKAKCAQQTVQVKVGVQQVTLGPTLLLCTMHDRSIGCCNKSTEGRIDTHNKLIWL